MDTARRPHVLGSGPDRRIPALRSVSVYHPDHDTIVAFRGRFLPEIEKLFVQILLLAREMGLLKLGTVGLDGTKVHANASRHSALSYEHAGCTPSVHMLSGVIGKFRSRNVCVGGYNMENAKERARARGKERS